MPKFEETPTHPRTSSRLRIVPVVALLVAIVSLVGCVAWNRARASRVAVMRERFAPLVMLEDGWVISRMAERAPFASIGDFPRELTTEIVVDATGAVSVERAFVQRLSDPDANALRDVWRAKSERYARENPRHPDGLESIYLVADADASTEGLERALFAIPESVSVKLVVRLLDPDLPDPIRADMPPQVVRVVSELESERHRAGRWARFSAALDRATAWCPVARWKFHEIQGVDPTSSRTHLLGQLPAAVRFCPASDDDVQMLEALAILATTPRIAPTRVLPIERARLAERLASSPRMADFARVLEAAYRVR